MPRILSSGCLEILPAFDLDRVLETTQAVGSPKLFAVPTIYSRFANLGGTETETGQCPLLLFGSGQYGAEIVRQWKERTGLTIYEGYGLTESALQSLIIIIIAMSLGL